MHDLGSSGLERFWIGELSSPRSPLRCFWDGVNVAQVTGTYFFTVEGISATQSFDLGIAQYILAGTGSMIGTALLQHFGRRPLWLIGLGGIYIVSLIVAILSLFEQTNGLIWAQGVLITVRQFAYGIA